MRAFLSVVLGVLLSAAVFVAVKLQPRVLEPVVTAKLETPESAQPEQQMPAPEIAPVPVAPAKPIGKADLIKVDKSARQLQLLRDGEVIASYAVALGNAPEGPKQQEGDERTPEGRYVIDWRNPKSRYFLSLHISYPDANDKARAKEAGVSPGGDIMIHGQPNGYQSAGPALQKFDWTNGCIAVTNAQMQEIWDAAPDGTPIEITP